LGSGSCSCLNNPHIRRHGGTEEIIAGVFETGGLRLDRALADASGLSRERIKALIEEGRVEVAGRVAAQASSKPGPGVPFSIRVPEAAPARRWPRIFRWRSFTKMPT
jgi:23S rRNA-/tRNA-specific pseudouridylate synthase